MNKDFHPSNGGQNGRTAAKSVVIHIGPPKSGTTTIQNALECLSGDSGVVRYATSGRFLEGGRWAFRDGRLGNVPGTGPCGNHAAIFYALEGMLISPDSETLLRQLGDEVGSATERLVVLSSEGFWFLREDAIRRLMDLLGDCRVTVVAYLRDPLRRFPSMYCQHLKQGTFGGSFTEFLRENDERLFEEYAIIRRWQGVFGQESVECRAFDRVCRSPGLVEDFFQLLKKLEPGETFVLPRGETEHTNIRQNDSFLRLLRAMNAVDLRFQSRQLARVCAYVRRIALGSRKCRALLNSLPLGGKPVILDLERRNFERFIESRFNELSPEAQAFYRDVFGNAFSLGKGAPRETSEAEST